LNREDAKDAKASQHRGLPADHADNADEIAPSQGCIAKSAKIGQNKDTQSHRNRERARLSLGLSDFIEEVERPAAAEKKWAHSIDAMSLR